MQKNNKYDLVCSLGGNCSCAANLKALKKRLYSLPFDWTYILSTKPIVYLAEGFKDNFKNFLLKENLEILSYSENDKRFHKDKVGYFDKYTNYYFVNHFLKDIDKYPSEYNKVYSKMRKRINRLTTLIKKANRILFVLSINFDDNYETIMQLDCVLKDLYPNKEFNFIILHFNSNEDSEIKLDNITIYKYKRSYLLSDFIQTINPEWNFLKDIKIKNNENVFYRILQINKIKNGIKINLFKSINTLFYCKLYFFGIRLLFTIGKDKD